MFNKNRLSWAILGALTSSTLAAPAALAQEDQMLEEIVVTGIRGSLQRSMDVKRDSAGVVDAISAEDIGKFPDTNLAESLQRITGVSIDRRQGEGATVTIRGFGADQNLVTLNGRHMPAASTFGGGSGSGGTRGGNTRSFDFANLASESVSGVEVYKTSKASIATGGIGGTVNILTTRPLDNPGLQGSVGVKAVHDTTAGSGDDITPEVSGLFSWTDNSDTFGVSLSASYQERHSGAAGAASNDWNMARWTNAEDSMYSFADDAVIENEPAEGQLYGRPNDIRYSYQETQRERTNAQLTLQFRPMDTLTLTGDYTFAENSISQHRGEQTFWYANGNNIDYLSFDDHAVKGPAIYSEQLSSKDNGYEQQLRENKDTLESIGFNAAWDVTDNFSLALDVHDSTMESLPDGTGNSGSIDISVANGNQTFQSTDWTRELPTTAASHDPSWEEGPQAWVDDFGSQVLRVWYSGQTTDMTQVKLDGSLEFDNGRFDFGIETRAMDMVQQSSNRNMDLGGWGVSNAGEIPQGLLEPFNLAAQYDDYDMSDSFQGGARGDVLPLAQWAVSEYGTAENEYQVAYNPEWAANSNIQEDTEAVYFQVAVEGELGGMATNLLTGFRYETTDVISISDIQPPRFLEWNDNNDFTLIQSDDQELFRVTNSYDHLLPSLDFDISLREDLTGRFSYSKTIARAGLGNLTPSVDGFGTSGSTYNGAVPRANASNPQLVPLESDNIDLSLEWYYDDASYASIGLFEKRVDNFVSTSQVMQTHFGMRDVTNGPRVEEAAAELEARGYNVNDTSLFAMTAVLDNPDDFPGGADDYIDTPDFAENTVALNYDLRPNSEDPLMEFSTATPTNSEEAKLYGAEFAVQHFFGDTGFGVQANYTVVRGDVKFDDEGDPSEEQFALVGLSDTANLVGIYENHGISARIAYNWRDKFLSQTNRGAGRNPEYTEAFATVDANISYEVTDNINVFFEGLNLTGENLRQHARSPNQLYFLEDWEPRYQLGARYTF